MGLNQDVFLTNGFDESSYQKIKKTLLKKNEDPFQKTDIKQRLESFFSFFDTLGVSREDVRKGITLAPEFLTHTPAKINQNILELSAYTNTSPQKLAGALIRQPISLTKNPKNILIILQKGAQIWNIDFKTLLSLSLKQPLLLTTPISKFNTFKNFFKLDFLNELTLMLIATITAFILGEYFESAFIIILFNFGEFLERIATDNSKRKIAGLSSLKVKTVNVITKEGLKVTV